MRFLKRSIFSLIALLAAIWDFGFYLYGQIWRIPNLVRNRWAGSDPLPDSNLAAVFVHFDSEGAIHDYVLHQLDQLVHAGFRVVFVSNAPKFPEDNVRQLAPFCRTIIWRHNRGYDFGAYKDGLRTIEGQEKLAALLLTNDSIYGPFSNLKDLLSDIDHATTDYWGITDSWQHNFHVQSYFILFFPNAINSEAFKKFWRRLPYVNRKQWVIRNGELKLSRVLARQKLRANVLAPYWSVAKTVMDRLIDLDIKQIGPHAHRGYLEVLREQLTSGQPLNPMHDFWETLITDYKCPFIKRDLTNVNPLNLPYAWRWPEVIQRVSRYDISMIQRHMQSLSGR